MLTSLSTEHAAPEGDCNIIHFIICHSKRSHRPRTSSPSQQQQGGADCIPASQLCLTFLASASAAFRSSSSISRKGSEKTVTPVILISCKQGQLQLSRSRKRE